MPSHYAERSARDPELRLRAIAAAAERKRRRRQVDPDASRAAHRAAMRRHRAKLRERGLTFTELLRRSPLDDAATLRLVLADEVRRGRVDYSAGRYLLNGGLPDDVKASLPSAHVGEHGVSAKSSSLVFELTKRLRQARRMAGGAAIALG